MSPEAGRVAIIGAGIGGLAAALALAKTGWQPVVFERRSELAEEGAGIQIGPNGAKVLSALGVLERARAQSSEPLAIVVHAGQDGQTTARLPLGRWIEERHGAPYITLHRQDLHAALFEAARQRSAITFVTGAEVTGYETANGGVGLQIRGQPDHSTALAIGADGLWSTLRLQLDPRATLSPSGACAYRGVIETASLPATIEPDCIHVYLLPDAHVVHYPVRQGRETALIAILEDQQHGETWTRTAEADWFKARRALFPVAVLEIFAAVPDWRMWPLFRSAPLSRWHDGGFVLLGDAAHPVLPYFAQGASMALEDGITLATALRSCGNDIGTALNAYSEARMARTRRVMAASARNGRIYHHRSALAAMRNLVLRSVSGERLMARYDWLYGWAPPPL